jgi:hypothetical protein
LLHRIADWDPRLPAGPGGVPPAERVVEVEVWVLDPAVRRAAEAVAGQLGEIAAAAERTATLAGGGADQLRAALAAAAATPPASPRPAGRRPTGRRPRPASPGQPARSDSPGQPARPAAPDGDGRPGLPKAQAAVLTVLAHAPQGRSKHELAILTGYVAGTGHFNNTLGELRTAGLISGTRNQPIRATAAGLAAIDGRWEPLPTGQQLLDYWAGRFGAAAGLILRELVGVWPAALTKAEVAARTRYVPDTGHFNNTLGRLRTAGLVTGKRNQPLRADDTLSQAVHADRS